VEEDKGVVVGVNVVMRYGLVCKKVTILKFFYSLNNNLFALYYFRRVCCKCDCGVCGLLMWDIGSRAEQLYSTCQGMFTASLTVFLTYILVYVVE